MLDVHPPHQPAHGVGDFFLHLFTITIGLLIAVGIEGAVERHEHHKLAAEAAEMMTAEIRHNQNELQSDLKGIAEEKKRLAANLAMVNKIQLDPKGDAAKNLNMDLTFNTSGLDRTAWRTAQATGALSWMPYEQAQRFSDIYDSADSLEKTQNSWVEDEGRLLGLIRRYMPSPQTPVTKEGADAMAQEFGTWQAHLLAVSIAARVLQEEQTAFLEHRAPPHSLSESLGN